MKGPVRERTLGILIFFFFTQLLYAQDFSLHPRFHTLDADRNGRISHAEFSSGMEKILLFEKWDMNHDGALDRQELYNKIKEAGNQPANVVALPVSYKPMEYSSAERAEAAEQFLKRFFRLADLNRDNRLQKVEFYLFLFRHYDADGNGSLMLSEYLPESLQ